MTLEEAIKHAEEVAEEKESEAQDLEYSKLDWKYEANQCSKCAEEHRQLAEWLRDYKRLKEQQPCGDCISREEAILQLQRYGVGCFEPDDFSVEQCTRFVINKLNELESVNSTYNNEKYKEFAEWVAEEIFSDDWEFNKDSFEELACRKLEKVGIVKLIDGHWVLVEMERL